LKDDVAPPQDRVHAPGEVPSKNEELALANSGAPAVSERPAQTGEPAATDSQRALFSLWAHVEEHFEDERAHGAFLAACDEAKDLSFAARLYRSRKESGSGEHALIAQKQLDKITGLAFAQLEAARTYPAPKNRTVLIVAAVVSVSLIGACVYLIGM
jgi:hypothetical protein